MGIQGHKYSGQIHTLAHIKPRREHKLWLKICVTFLVCVALPCGLFAIWNFLTLPDQYEARAILVVQREQTNTDLSLSLYSGMHTHSHTALVRSFVESDTMINQANSSFDFDQVFGATLSKLSTVLHPYSKQSVWKKFVDIQNDPRTGLVEIRVRTTHPNLSEKIAEFIISSTENMLFNINQISSNNQTASSKLDVEQTGKRLQLARVELEDFRNRVGFIDPKSVLDAQNAVLAELSKELTVLERQRRQLLSQTSPNNSRLMQINGDITILKQQLTEQVVANANSAEFSTFPSLITEFERLVQSVNFAEESHQLALSQLDTVVTQAREKSVFLTEISKPTSSQNLRLYLISKRTLVFSFFLASLWFVFTVLKASTNVGRSNT